MGFLSRFKRNRHAQSGTELPGYAHPEANPLAASDRDMKAADELMANGHAARAAEMLEGMLRSLETVKGRAVDQFRPRVLGRLGIALYRAGQHRRAIEITRQALALCQQAADQEGIRAYTENLRVIEGGGELVMYDLGEGRISWEVRGGEATPQEAILFHEEGREAGSRGDYIKALALFTRASVRAPSWPYPVYDRAYTHLLMNTFDAALTDYERVLELAPRGFFIAHTAVDTLRREANGEFPPGLFLAYTTLEHMAEDQRRHILGQLVEKHPRFAPGWLKWAELADGPREQLAAIDCGLSANPDPNTRDMLRLNKAVRLDAAGDRHGAVAILRDLIADPALTAATEPLAKDMLRRFGAPPATEGV